jgi:hypothetical protein
MLATYLCSAAIDLIVHKGEDRDRVTILTWMTAVFLFGTLINPYGFELWVFLKRLNENYVTQEMQPLNWSTSSIYVIVYSMMLLCAMYSWRRVAWPRLILAAVFFVIGCMHARLIIYFCLSSCPLVAQAVSEMLPNITRLTWIASLSDSIKVAAFKRYYPVAVSALSVIVVLSQPIYLSRLVPIKAADWLSLHTIAGNLFCSAHAGSYLIYRLHGSVKVFMDTRVDLYDPALCGRYVSAMAGTGWRELFSQYNIGATLLPESSQLEKAIEVDPDWKKIYDDNDFSISTRVGSPVQRSDKGQQSGDARE